MAHLGGGNKGYFIPGIILFYAMEYKLKASEINLFHRIKVKNIKKLFLCGNFD
jgi:hypothetical protein